MIPSDSQTLDAIAVVLLVLAAPPANMFPVVYAFRPWRDSLIGRALMAMAIGLGVMIDVGLMTLILGSDYPGRGVVRVVAFTLVVSGIWFQFLAMAKATGPRRQERGLDAEE